MLALFGGVNRMKASFLPPGAWGVVVKKDFLEEEAWKQGGGMSGNHYCPNSDQESCVSLQGHLFPFPQRTGFVPKDFWPDLELTTLAAFVFHI